MAGQPTKYSDELADKICVQIASSCIGLAKICKGLGISSDSVYKWLNENKEFSDKYARAREEQADFLADEILEIADDGTKDTKIIFDKAGNQIEVEDTEWTNRSRLRVDARKWVASKLAPKKYSDKHQVEGKIELVQILNIDPMDDELAT